MVGLLEKAARAIEAIQKILVPLLVVALAIFIFLYSRSCMDKDGLGSGLPFLDNIPVLGHYFHHPSHIIEGEIDVDTLYVTQYETLPPVAPVAGAIILSHDLQMDVLQDSLMYTLHYDMPHHGPIELYVGEDGMPKLTGRRIGLEANLLGGISTRGPVFVGVEGVYVNNLFGIQDLNLHALGFGEAEFENGEIVDGNIGIAGDVDVFPDYTNLRLGAGAGWPVGETKAVFTIFGAVEFASF